MLLRNIHPDLSPRFLWLVFLPSVTFLLGWAPILGIWRQPVCFQRYFRRPGCPPARKNFSPDKTRPGRTRYRITNFLYGRALPARTPGWATARLFASGIKIRCTRAWGFLFLWLLAYFVVSFFIQYVMNIFIGYDVGHNFSRKRDVFQCGASWRLFG